MSGAPIAGVTADLDLCGRIALTHAICVKVIARALRLEPVTARAIVAGTAGEIVHSEEDLERVPLIANILVRIEIRFDHDSRAIRAVLDQPLDRLGGASIGSKLEGNAATLRELRGVIDDLRTVPTKWWRVGH